MSIEVLAKIWKEMKRKSAESCYTAYSSLFSQS